ncbi:MAG TPA: hypothetical protein VFM37_00760, partial [Pseudonocardiaceae bacterium]|nr:hypothetical protein [Pseudonocardiaceae bacterium]
MRRQITRTLSLLLLAFVAPLSTARAALERVGPVVPAHGYPAWYQDETGLSLELCDNLTPAELQESWCLLLPGDVPGMPPLGAATRELFPDVFSNEHFYWAAHATFDVENDAQNRASLVLGLEAAFASGPVIPGDQMTFGRIRILVKSLPHSGTYTVYTPFGVYVFPDEVAGNKLFFTEDIGVNCALGTFHCALVSNLGPFLLPSPTPGGPEMPPVTPLNPTPDTNPAHFGGGVFIPTPYPGTGKKYIADPKRVGPVTGSPLPDFATSGGPRNPNIFRMEVRLATGQTIVVGETVDFSLMGRIFEGTIPGRITVEGASYANGVAASPTGAKLDVFATAFPTKQGRLPAAPETFPTPPLLQFYEGACAADPVTGAPSGPAAPGLPATQMVAEASRYWGQSSPLAVPPEVCLAQTNAINADGVLASVYYRATVADEVTVTEATYVPSVSLLVKATSSNVANPPTLTLTGFGDLVGGQYALPAPLSPLLPPPATVRVASTAGGLGELQVSTGLGTLSAPAVPVAGDDLVQIVEDTPAPAIDVLANDTFNGSPIGFDPATVAITIASAPRLGVATVNADGTLG